MSVGGIARGGLFLFLGSAFQAILGFVYWFLISILCGAEVVGITSSIYNLSVLILGIATLGVPVGVQRFLGRDFSQRNIEDLNTYFWSSFTFTIALSILSGISIWCIALLNVAFVGFSMSMLFLTGLLVSLCFWTVVGSLFISIAKTEYLAISPLVSGIVKLCSGVLLVYLGFGWFGAVMGLIFENASMVAIMLFFALRELRRLGSVKIRVSREMLRESLRAGFVSWLPGVIALLGQQLSFLAVFSLQGGLDAGTYYIAYQIFVIVYLLPTSLTNILFPILSGLTHGRREVAWKSLKLCLALACPSATFLVFYSAFPLSLLGGDYVQAAPTLSLLASSIVPLTFCSAVYSLAYASGSYGKVLGIGLATNAPRALLYFLLVPIYSGFGAALSFLVGALTGLVAAAYISKVTDFQVSLRKVAVTIAVPFGAALLCFLAGLGWFIGGILILLTSVFFYGRLGVIERSDLTDIARAFVSEKAVAKAGQRVNWLLRIIYGG